MKNPGVKIFKAIATLAGILFAVSFACPAFAQGKKKATHASQAKPATEKAESAAAPASQGAKEGAQGAQEGQAGQEGKEADDEQPKVKVERGAGGKKVYKIEGEIVIEGKIQKPEAFYVLQKSSINYDWHELKQEFVPKILDSVTKAPF